MSAITPIGILNGEISLSPKKQNGNYDTYTGIYTVEPDTDNDRVLATKDKVLISNITVKKIEYSETSNDTGTTVYIGG